MSHTFIGYTCITCISTHVGCTPDYMYEMCIAGVLDVFTGVSIILCNTPKTPHMLVYKSCKCGTFASVNSIEISFKVWHIELYEKGRGGTYKSKDDN